MSTYQQLLSQKAALEKQSADIEKQLLAAKRAERADVIAQIKSLMLQYDLTLSDLGSIKSKPKKSKKEANRKVAIKFHNPATGDSWSGRGLKPKWLQVAIGKGKKPEDFAV